MPIRVLILTAVLVVPARAAAPPRPKPPEAIKMLAAILSGKPPGPPFGWFGTSETLYDWDWLAARCGVPPTGSISPARFPGTKAEFDRIDRDGDGRISRADLDPRARRPSNDPRDRMLDSVIARADRDKDGRLSAREWQSLFEQAAGEKGNLTREDLRRILLPDMTKSAGKPTSNAGMPSRWTLLQGFLSGEIGSMHEGPALGATAPEFTLKTPDGKRSLSLRDLREKKPVVLIFGSFT